MSPCVQQQEGCVRTARNRVEQGHHERGRFLECFR